MYLLRPVNRLQPPRPSLHKLLDRRLQLTLMQTEIIDRPDPEDTRTRKSATPTVQQRPAHGTKEVSHRVARFDGVGFGEVGELFFALEVDEACVFYDDVGGEHGG